MILKHRERRQHDRQTRTLYRDFDALPRKDCTLYDNSGDVSSYLSNFYQIMPNKKAKDRKRFKRKLNEKWNREGRTSVQHKKYLKKQNKLKIGG